jgi:2-polyprenyl-3-methyl-5-hydroxy-6-metoxy-1,4-benzoquinol methylase
MISLNNEPCCVCGETRSLLVQETTYPEHGYPGSFRLRKCGKCGLLFNSPRLDEKELAELYGQNYYFFNRTDAKELARIVSMYARTVALVADEVTKKQCLDVGCGRGYFPAVLKELGWDAHGVEISPQAAQYARERFGLEHVFTGTIEQYASSDRTRRFGLVTAIDVIEHVPWPDAFIAALAKVVEEKGLLIVDTPNAAAYNIKVDGETWQGFNPFHIYLFTILNLRQLLAKHSFHVEQSFSYNNVPADSMPPTTARKLRMKALDTARLLGVARPLAKLYFNLSSRPHLTRRKLDVPAMVKQAAEMTRAAPPYLKTPDAEEPLARDATGDNIVVIARKRDAS